MAWLSGSALAHFGGVQNHGLDDECLQCHFVNLFFFMDVDGTNGLAIQARIEEPFGILDLSTRRGRSVVLRS